MEAGENGAMRAPDERTIRTLLDWRPERGVISAYVAIDPADRGEPWRVELRKQLDAVVEAEQDKHGRRPALQATVERIKAHFPEVEPPSGRCHIGFCEVAEKDGRDIWMAVQMHRDETEVVDRDHPYLTPLLELLDEGAPVGVLAVSAERVRLYEWALGSLSDVQDWEAVLFMPDWRERKAQSSPDPARVQGPSSSGHDQFDQRLDANRERFLEQVGGLVGQEADARRWRRVLTFGDAHQVDEVRQGVKDRVPVELADDADLISENDRGSLLERVEAAVRRDNRRREVELVGAAIDAANTPNGRGATGLAEIEQSLTQGRVRHLLFDAESSERDVLELEDDLVEAALRTSAEVTPVEGEAAEMLRDHGGVAALLRY
jgi:peptide subunit release factor 1 (eRF1)